MLRITEAAEREPVSLDEARRQVRADGCEFDAILPGLITAAREIVEQQTGYALAEASYEWTPEGDETTPPLQPATVDSEEGESPILFTTNPGPMPGALRQAILLMVHDLLANPGASSDKELKQNPAFENLVFPYRRIRP
jgi:hypothetical protein